MSRERVEAILSEYRAVRDPNSADAELEALRAAVFLEDAFGIQLTDTEIAESLGSADAVRALVLGKLDVT